MDWGGGSCAGGIVTSGQWHILGNLFTVIPVKNGNPDRPRPPDSHFRGNDGFYKVIALTVTRPFRRFRPAAAQGYGSLKSQPAVAK